LEKLNGLVREVGGVPSTPDGAEGVLKLPTEAEWEYAARGAEGPRYIEQDPYGGDLERHEVFFLPGSEGKAKEVASHPPNSLGLHDMLGNVRELMEGNYSIGGVAGGGSLLKGGAYLSERSELRSSVRTEHQRFGEDGKPSRRSDAGLRLCISAEIFTSLGFDNAVVAHQESAHPSPDLIDADEGTVADVPTLHGSSGLVNGRWPVKVMLIGDALSVGGFGDGMESLLLRKYGSESVAIFASCGSSPENWLTGGFVTNCGYRQTTPTGRVLFEYKDGQNPPPVRTPQLRSLLERYHPEIVIVQLGTAWMNALTASDMPDVGYYRRIIADFINELKHDNSAATIFWVLPPASSEYPQRIHGDVEKWINESSRRMGFYTINSRAVTVPYREGITGSDGIHYSDAAGFAWARSVFSKFTAALLALSRAEPNAIGAQKVVPLDSGSPTADRTDDGSTLIVVPGGQTFYLPPGKGLLGPSSDPSSQKPFINEEGWCVAVNEAPATRSSIVHLYVQSGDGSFREVADFHKSLVEATLGKAQINAYFLRVERISGNILSVGSAMFDSPQPKEVMLKVKLLRDGNIAAIDVIPLEDATSPLSDDSYNRMRQAENPNYVAGEPHSQNEKWTNDLSPDAGQGKALSRPSERTLQPLEIFEQQRVLVFPQGYTVHNDAGGVLKTVPGPAELPCMGMATDKTFAPKGAYLSDWSYERIRKGEQPNWVVGVASDPLQAVEAADPGEKDSTAVGSFVNEAQTPGPPSQPEQPDRAGDLRSPPPGGPFYRPADKFPKNASGIKMIGRFVVSGSIELSSLGSDNVRYLPPYYLEADRNSGERGNGRWFFPKNKSVQLGEQYTFTEESPLTVIKKTSFTGNYDVLFPEN
jgi:hypothetical protein